HAAGDVMRDVLDGVAENLAVGDDEAAVVEGVELGREDVDLVDDGRDARDGDDVADLEGAEDEQHHARGEVAERAGEGHAEGKADGGDGRGKGGRFDAEGVEDGQGAEDDDG